MDKFVIYDTETTNSTIWGSIIEVGAVVVDKNLNEIGKLNIQRQNARRRGSKC